MGIQLGVKPSEAVTDEREPEEEKQNNFAETNYEEAVEQQAKVQEPEPEIQKPTYEPENPIPEPEPETNTETTPQFYELPPNIDSHPIFHNNQTSQNYHQQ